MSEGETERAPGHRERSEREREGEPESEELSQNLLSEHTWSSNGGSPSDHHACIRRNHKHDGVSATSILDQGLESLLHRLRGLCDNMEPETFADHESVYLLKGQQASPFVLRARRPLDRPGSPWHLRYLGQPEAGDRSRHTLVRNCVDIATSEVLPEFLQEMGFRMDHEFVARGHLFRKGVMKIAVYKVFRVLVAGTAEGAEPLSLSYLVELSVVAPAGQDSVADEVRSFAEQLRPLVQLEKIDPKRLM